MTAIASRVRFDGIRYANCWEDASILCDALEVERGGRYLSIASGGDNAFALLAAGADEVVAADLSPAQLALVELKALAIRHLERPEALAFLGLTRCRRRLATYARLEEQLSAMARAFWSKHRRMIARGVIHGGKFERYFSYFRRFVLPLIHRRRTVEALMSERDLSARRRFYDEVWDTRRWRLLFRLFFGRAVMGHLGRDPELFRYVEGSVSERILYRVSRALVEAPTHDNPFLEYILTGTFARNPPRYLRPGAYARLRGRLRARPECLTLGLGDVAEVGQRHTDVQSGGFDGFNLSDVFEYLDSKGAAALYRSLLSLARPRARFAYWNMLAPRARPEDLRFDVEITGRGAELFEKDQAFFYSAFHVEAAR